jgi:hypothetical protein
VPAGLILGVGLENKHSIGFFALALVIGLLLSGGRGLLASRYFALGALIAAACTIPDVWWQAQHGWATIAMSRTLAQENGGLPNAVGFLLSQVFMASPVLIGVWIIGLRSLWRSRQPVQRALVWSYGLLVVFFAATSGAKPYYVAAAYFFLIAAGAVTLERRWAERVSRGEGTSRVRPLLIWLAASMVITAAISLPVLPANLIGWTSNVNPVLTESVGWPQLVGTVDRVWRGLPATQRARAVIFTTEYGEAGAINELGRADHLPEAVSGHNSLWFWGPGDPRATTVVAVLPGPQDGPGQLLAHLRRDFAQVKVVATLSNPAHLRNQEAGGHVYVCTGPVRPWGQLWPSYRHYG